MRQVTCPGQGAVMSLRARRDDAPHQRPPYASDLLEGLTMRSPGRCQHADGSIEEPLVCRLDPTLFRTGEWMSAHECDVPRETLLERRNNLCFGTSHIGHDAPRTYPFRKA